MKNRERFVCIMLLVLIIGQFPVFATEIMKPVEELSAPNYCGRLSGTEGIKLAEEYNAEQFREIGLAFLEGYEDYFQEFVQPVRLMNQPPKMSIIEDTGEVIAFRYLKDFVASVGPGMSIDAETEAKGIVLKDISQLKTISETVAGKILLIPADVFKKNQGYIMKSIINANKKPAGIILGMNRKESSLFFMRR